MPSKQEILRMKARYAANSLDYKKVIVERSFAKDWKPKFPFCPIPRMRNVVAFANRYRVEYEFFNMIFGALEPPKLLLLLKA